MELNWMILNDFMRMKIDILALIIRDVNQGN